MTPLWVAVVLGALVVAALRRSGHKEIARWATVAFVCVCLVVIAIGVHKIMTTNQETTSPLTTPSHSFPSSSSPCSPTSSSQVVLAFTGLQDPEGVAVDSVGAEYVADYTNNGEW